MCGIAGYFGLTKEPGESLAMLKSMCDTITHRGPDDQGYFHGPQVGLGMRRLSIVDLESGHQPMSGANGAVQLVFNGEIYNYRELRAQLSSHGHKFHTQSDTEVVLRQFEGAGIKGISALNGMFAIAIWDAREQRLWLARDRLGVKPLYYYWDGHELLFGSEIKVIHAALRISPAVRPCALWDYLTLRYVPAPDTIWQNIHKVPPGHRLVIDTVQRSPSVSRYWDIAYHDPIQGNDTTDYVGQFGSLFEDAVHRRMVADVPVGILLSGGLDSSAVASVASEGAASKVSMFSVAFEDSPETNELPYARAMAKHVKADHHVVEIGVDQFWDFLPQMVHYLDEPVADLASIPLYYVSRLAREHVKVVLSGEGADEVLAGYNFDQLVSRWEDSNGDARPASRLSDMGLHKLWQALGFARSVLPAMSKLPDLRDALVPYSMTNYLSSAEKQGAFRTALSCTDSLDSIRQALHRIGATHPLHQVLYTYCQDWLVEDLLMKADRMSMANSLELRTPFLDYRLVEWAAQTPAAIKVGNDTNGRLVTKRVLREFALSRLPQELVDRPKLGFPVPAYDWLGGPLRHRIVELLSSVDVQLRNWFETSFIKQTLQDGVADGASTLSRHRLWNLAVLEFWMQHWIKP